MSTTTATKKSTNVTTARLVAHYNSAATLGKNPKSAHDALRLLSRKNRYGVVAVGSIAKLL
ncbi:MAG: hypothetical protein K0U72_06545 [Gammaproteobacteria bacterium]|nr:hypothetical protein [Gammaproteobacteria bacterium]